MLTYEDAPPAHGVARYRDGDGYLHAQLTDEQFRSNRVYFIRAGEPGHRGRGPVKIGFSTDVERRLRELQTASPVPLRVVERVIATPEVEALLHRRVCGWGRHLLGEWFDLSNDDIAELSVQLAEEGLSAW